MFRARWRTVVRPPLIPPLIVMGTAALLSLAAAQLAAAAPLFRTLSAADCSTAGAATRAIARHAGRPAIVAQQLDAGGAFTGRALTLSGRATIALPPDSFVAPRVGDALIYTSSAAGRSDIHLVDLAAGCDAVIARSEGVVRSAILAPDGSSIYFHSVTFPARADAGVNRYGLADGVATAVVPPLPDDSRFGLTFATQLGWSTDKTRLFVQSCAVDRCRTRLLEPESGSVSTFDAGGQGPIIGVTPDHLVTYAACDGLPCAVVSIDRTTGAARVLADLGWSTSMATNAAGNPVVRIETATGTLEVAQ